ncbi:CBS domain-containing protein [Nocardia sp. bgisy134]|uniref:CBS domain-containing protein n=1 Tax=unclassified Nocardia TaxID=2637762 RepID=UPI003D74D389
MTIAKDVMRRGGQWISAEQTVQNAAWMMAAHGVDVLVVGDDENDRLSGVLTYRAIALKCVAAGLPPDRTTVGALFSGTPRWVDSRADLREVLDEMNSHHLRHIPVVEDRRLVGTISENDLVDHLDSAQLGEFVRAHAAA